MIRQNENKILKTCSRPGLKCILLGWVFLLFMELADLAKIPGQKYLQSLWSEFDRCQYNMYSSNSSSSVFCGGQKRGDQLMTDKRSVLTAQ